MASGTEATVRTDQNQAFCGINQLDQGFRGGPLLKKYLLQRVDELSVVNRRRIDHFLD